MNVRERAKAYEDAVVRSSFVGESPPPRKKSREELIGYIDDNNSTEKKSPEDRPTPPPRKCKKKEEINKSNNSSPTTERKENIPEQITPKQSENAKTHSSPQQTTVTVRKKKQGPPPPPPPRGSSLDRNIKNPLSTQTTSAKKKERPPVPPKPKNYYPKVSSSGVNKVSTSSSNGGGFKTQRAESMPSERPLSQFFVGLEEQSVSLKSTKREDAESKSQFFVAKAEPNLDDSSSRTETTEGLPNRKLSTETKERNKVLATENSKETSCVEHQQDVRVTPLKTRTQFTSYVVLTEQGNSAQETVDSLEGLEVHDVPLDYEEEDDNEMPYEEEILDHDEITDSQTVNGTREDDVVVSIQDPDESPTQSNSKESSDIGVASLEERTTTFEHATQEEAFNNLSEQGQENQQLDEGISSLNNDSEEATSECLPAGETLLITSDNLGQKDFEETTGEEPAVSEQKGTITDDLEEDLEQTAEEERVDVDEQLLTEETVLLHSNDHCQESPEEMLDDGIDTCISRECMQLEEPVVMIEKQETAIEDLHHGDDQEEVIKVYQSGPEEEPMNLHVVAFEVQDKEVMTEDVDILETQAPVVAADESREECIAARLSVVDEHLSVSQQQSIANQEQSIDEVNTNTDEEPHPYIHVADRDDKDDIIIVAEPIKEGTLMTVSDDAVVDECTAGVYVAAEESTLLLPDKDVETVMKEGETEELETPFVGENEVEHDVLESEQENKNFSFAQMDSTALETQAQESDLKGVELEEQEGASDGNKLTELSEGGNLEKSDHEDQIHDNVVGEHETKTVVVSVCCKEVLQHESTEEAIASSTQETSQEALFEESQDAAVLHSGASDEVPEEGIIDAAVSVFQEGELPEVAEDERKSEPGSPVSPDPLRPERPNRQAKLQKHIYEEVGMSTQIEHQQVEETEYNSVPIISERRPLNSGYENVILAPVPHPLPPTNDNDDDESIYKVPTKVVSVESYLIDESEYSVPPRHLVIEDAEYAVPKPIVVQASQVTENTETDLEVYAVPGLATQVPVIETVQSAQSSNHGEVYAVPRENDNMYVVPMQQKTVTVTTVMVSAVPPPKPPRTSLSEENHKPPTQVIAEVQPTGSPKPVPRSRLANGSGTPEAVPRKGESPSPVPRKSSKTSQNDVDPSKTSVPSNGSPVPLPRSRVNAIESNTKESAASNGVTASLASNISTVDSEETEGTIKRSPPPRPPPPLFRVSVVGNDEEMPPLSPGFVDSDSDSDVGEEPVNKGPSKPKTYHIAHEILSTERTFVDALQLVNEECYGTIKSANVISESVLSDIFRDLENIYLLDSRFLQELEERMKTWEEHERIGDIVKKYGHFLKMYTTFVNGYDKAMTVFQETMKENTEFAKLVLDFQASERCHGMQLSAYMLKPVQRVPSYRLLLIDYLKHLPKDSEECKDTEAALKIVSEVATHINESMKKMDSFEQLLKLQRMLVGHPEIVKAGRDYLKEGTLMKLCRKDMQERMFFLLTDVLLYTTAVGVNQYKLNKMLPLLGMQVTVPDSPDLVNEFSIISTTRSFTLTASTPEERDKWVEDLNKAIDVVTKRKITFANKSKDATSSFEQDEDAKLGEKAPVWIPDARVTMCMSCTTPFNFTNRRHHCRACGKVICGSCSDCTAPLAYLDFEQTRVCDKCYELLLREFHTDEIHVDTETRPLPPLLQESENAEKLLKKPTKFEMTRRFRSKKTKKRKSHIMHPSHLTEVVGNEEGSQVSGYLRCKKGRTGWKKSWFVLKDRVLYAYKASSDVVALESIPVLGYEIQDLGKDEDDFLFNLKHKGITPLAFKADNEGSATRWIQELKKAVNLE